MPVLELTNKEANTLKGILLVEKSDLEELMSNEDNAKDKKELEDRIKQRVDIMFHMGAVDEMKKLLSMGAEPSWPGMQGIGYREWFDALSSGECNISSIKDMIVRSSIKYAKRQMTFFSSFKETSWLSPKDYKGINELIKKIQD